MQQDRNARWAVAIYFALLVTSGLPTAAGQLWPAPIRDPNRRFQKEVVSWKEFQEQFIVMQKTDYSCGAACLATVARYFWGDHATEDDFLDAIEDMLTTEELEDRIKNGLTLTDLRRAAVRRGYLAVIGKRQLSELLELKAPVIIRIVADKHEHFVVLRGIVNDRVYLADPIRGNLRIAFCQFADQWDNRAILAIAKTGRTLPNDSPLFVQRRPVMQPELQPVRRFIQYQTTPRAGAFLRP